MHLRLGRFGLMGVEIEVKIAAVCLEERTELLCEQ